MIKKLRNWFKAVVYDAINDRQLELTAQSNIPSELVDSTGKNLDLTADSNVPIEVQKTFFTQNPDGAERQVTTQNPLPVSDGIVCSNDIWVSESDMDDFSGLPTDLFDNLHTMVTDTTSNNPKELTIHFNNAIITSIIAIGAYDTNGGIFSNVEIQVARSDGTFITVVDDSADSTIIQTADYALPITIGFNAIKLIFHTANTISISNLVIPKSKAVVSRMQATSALTGEVEDITSYRKTLNVNNAFVHRKIVNETYHQHTGTTTTPSVAITAGDTSITFTDTTGFAIGSEFKLTEGSTQEGGIITITNIVALVVTLDRPIGNDYTTAADIEEVLTNMNVSGTLAAPQIFEIDPPIGTVWQFTRILISITDATVMDDARFGGLLALTNGISLRATTQSGRTVVFANWKANSDMKLDMFNVDYSDKAPAGFYGLNGRWTFTAAEVVAELDGDASPIQKLEVLVQDDLTGLTTFEIRAQGRVFSP